MKAKVQLRHCPEIESVILELTPEEALALRLFVGDISPAVCESSILKSQDWPTNSSMRLFKLPKFEKGQVPDICSLIFRGIEDAIEKTKHQ